MLRNLHPARHGYFDQLDPLGLMKESRLVPKFMEGDNPARQVRCALKKRAEGKEDVENRWAEWHGGWRDGRGRACLSAIMLDDGVGTCVYDPVLKRVLDPLPPVCYPERVSDTSASVGVRQMRSPNAAVPTADNNDKVAKASELPSDLHLDLSYPEHQQQHQQHWQVASRVNPQVAVPTGLVIAVVVLLRKAIVGAVIRGSKRPQRARRLVNARILTLRTLPRRVRVSAYSSPTDTRAGTALVRRFVREALQGALSSEEEQVAVAIQLTLPPASSIFGMRADQAFVIVHHQTSAVVGMLESSRLTARHVYLAFQCQLDSQPLRITGMQLHRVPRRVQVSAYSSPTDTRAGTALVRRFVREALQGALSPEEERLAILAIQLALPRASSIFGMRADQAFVVVYHQTLALDDLRQSTRTAKWFLKRIGPNRQGRGSKERRRARRVGMAPGSADSSALVPAAAGFDEARKQQPTVCAGEGSSTEQMTPSSRSEGATLRQQEASDSHGSGTEDEGRDPAANLDAGRSSPAAPPHPAPPAAISAPPAAAHDLYAAVFAAANGSVGDVRARPGERDGPGFFCADLESVRAWFLPYRSSSLSTCAPASSPESRRERSLPVVDDGAVPSTATPAELSAAETIAADTADIDTASASTPWLAQAGVDAAASGQSSAGGEGPSGARGFGMDAVTCTDGTVEETQQASPTATGLMVAQEQEKQQQQREPQQEQREQQQQQQHKRQHEPILDFVQPRLNDSAALAGISGGETGEATENGRMSKRRKI